MAASTRTGLPPNCLTFSSVPFGATVTVSRTVPPIKCCFRVSGYCGSTRVSSVLWTCWPSATIGEGPVEGRMVLAELTEVAVVALGAYPQLIGQLGGEVQPEVSKPGAAILIRGHGQPIIASGVNVPWDRRSREPGSRGRRDGIPGRAGPPWPQQGREVPSQRFDDA